VANTQRLSPAVLQQIRSSLLNLKPLKDPEAEAIVKSWSRNLRYGAVAVDDSAYDPIRQQWLRLKVDLIGAEQ
jgi:phosphonate transport system substrate-binding protein